MDVKKVDLPNYSHYETLFIPIKAKLQENPERMYEIELIAQVLPTVDPQYDIEDLEEAIDMISDEVVIKELSEGRYLRLKK